MDANVIVTPQIQVILPNDETLQVSFADIALDGDSPATISDNELIARLTRFYDGTYNLTGYKVTRPSSGNILVTREFRYG